MLLQSYDYLHLFRQNHCTLQIGGDDQWSNILSGMELIRRLAPGNRAYCLTLPLLATSDGRKMGKTEKGAVWLDPDLTSPYEYFQYWRNIEDAKVAECLAYFTELPMSEVKALSAAEGSGMNKAKEVLAFEATKLLHGEDAASESIKSARSLFGAGQGAGAAGGAGGPEKLIPRQDVVAGMDILELMRLTDLAPSRAEARRLVAQGGVTINGASVRDPAYQMTLADFGENNEALVRKGKKVFIRVKLTN
jgi:tyrosyl-tRNA synthetase